jgi:hypothetical protein
MHDWCSGFSKCIVDQRTFDYAQLVRKRGPDGIGRQQAVCGQPFGIEID